ncbi:MAG: 2-isopropylmalate synthase [Planctomycetes bacterium]|nr:2-isopropylmalate synthase [Planctomycetota bacterium]
MPDKASKRVIVFDTTLRDGEQSPGASLNLTEKLEVARALELLGVDVIEAGFPITSPDDFEAVRAIAREVTKPAVCGLARCVPKDIDRAAEAVAAAKRPRVHVFLATSRIHRQFKLRKARREILRLAVDGVSRAKAAVPDVQFSPEDAARTEPEFLAQVVEAVIDAGAATVNIPDTVGWSTPERFRALIEYLFDRVANIAKAVIAVHCHDDLGMAVANTLAAVQAGARQVEVTVNGIGERAGNAALEEIVMALRTRPDAFAGCSTNIRTNLLYATSRLVSRVTGLAVARNKAVVGENAFAHESGIHADGVLKKRTTYEIMDPRSVGLARSKLVLGKHSGRHQFRRRLGELGFRLSPRQVDGLFGAFKELADRKKEVFDEDLVALVESEVPRAPETWRLCRLTVATATGGMAAATVELQNLKTREHRRDAATGDGPVDAIFHALERMTGVRLVLEDYQIRAVTSGTEAQGEARLQARHGGLSVTGRGVSTDILEASAKAYLSVINRVVARV